LANSIDNDYVALLLAAPLTLHALFVYSTTPVCRSSHLRSE